MSSRLDEVARSICSSSAEVPEVNQPAMLLDVRDSCSQGARRAVREASQDRCECNTDGGRASLMSGDQAVLSVNGGDPQFDSSGSNSKTS